MASFFITLGTGEEKLLSSEKPLLRIGRLPESEILIEEPVVSRHHAEIFQSDHKYFVRDAGSTNGTFLNGKRIFQATELAPGSAITVGSSRIVYEPTESVSFQKERAAEKPSSTVSLARPAEVSQVMAPLVLLQTVAAIAREIVRPRPLESLLDSVLRICVERTGADRAAIMLFDQAGKLAPRAYFSRIRSAGKFAVSMSIVTRAIAENQAVLIKDVAGDENLKMSESVANLRIRSAICTPLWNGEKTVGVLYVDTTMFDRQFGETDLFFFSSLSGLIAEKIENTILGEIAREKQKLDTEIEIARGIQQHLFPKEIPAIEGYDVACFNRPSAEVGGDYFDVLAIGKRFGLAIADVAGKGISAAILMSNLQAILRSKAPGIEAPDELLRQMNVDLLDRVGEGRFISLCYLMIEPNTDRVVYANAGHNPPYLVRVGGNVETLEASGIPLGILSNTEYQANERNAAPGDLVALYSDGITEAMNSRREQFGDERFIEVLKANLARKASEIVDSVLLAVDTFREEEPFSDDMTLMILRRT